MSRLFPFRTSAESDADSPRLVDISEDAADDVFAALSSGTARATYKALHDEPRTASDLAELTDTSLQNVRYHLDNLGEAGLIEVVDTWYSERGTEMKVYAPADTGLVVFAGDDDDRDTVWSVLKNLVGGVGALGLASLVVQRVATENTVLPTSAPGAGENVTGTTTAGGTTAGTTTAGGTIVDQTATTTTAPETTSTVTTAAPTTPEATHTVTTTASGTTTETAVSYTQTTTQTYATHTTTTTGETYTHATQTTIQATHTAATHTTTTTTDAAAATAHSLPPGLLFFLGGLVVLLSVLVWQYAR